MPVVHMVCEPISFYPVHERTFPTHLGVHALFQFAVVVETLIPRGTGGMFLASFAS